VVGAVRLASGQQVTAALCLSDPGAVVKRDMAWKPPRWDGDTPEAEPLLLWQERALRAAGLLRPDDHEPFESTPGYWHYSCDGTTFGPFASREATLHIIDVHAHVLHEEKTA
jgi:hypothetical protein